MSQPPLSVPKAILIGHLAITLPILGLVALFGAIGALAALVLFRPEPLAFRTLLRWIGLGVVVGCVPGWLWWSFLVPRWRRWAHQRGASPERLHKWAVATGLEWPKGWIFEKTEFKVD